MAWRNLEGMYDVPFKELDTLEQPGQSYSFDFIGLVQCEDGRLWYAQTSGCSCPGTYHEYRYDEDTLDSDMSPLNAFTFRQFEEEVMKYCEDWDRKPSLEEKKNFIETARRYVFKEGK